MLLNFWVENFLSFVECGEEPTFSMLSGKGEAHSECRAQYGRTKILPCAAIYGPNSSGKSNFVKAIAFAQDLIINLREPGTRINNLSRFKLDPALLKSKPATFQFEILVDEKRYIYGFDVTSETVIDEWLYKVQKSGTEKTIYDRKEKNGCPLRKNTQFKNIADNVAANQLLLTSLNYLNFKNEDIRAAYKWFKSTNLVCVYPESKFYRIDMLSNREFDYTKYCLEKMKEFNVGIIKFAAHKINNPNLTPNLKEHLYKQLKNNETRVTNFSNDDNGFITYYLENGEIKAEKIVALKKDKNGETAEFNLVEESDGTRRLLDILPATFAMNSSNSDTIYIIDEMERSLHPELVRELLKEILRSRKPESRSQLIFTTHNVMLMDQSLFRRDALWICDKDEKQSTRMHSIGDYKNVRIDTDIRKAYLNGSFGGLPTNFSDETSDESYLKDLLKEQDAAQKRKHNKSQA